MDKNDCRTKNNFGGSEKGRIFASAFNEKERLKTPSGKRE